MEEAFAELFETIDSKKVEAIGVTGQMHTVILLIEKKIYSSSTDVE